jgi:uncharacterized alpha-E superfamily protein
VSRLLARYAESVFWLARYVERAENLARILEVQETFARDSKGAHDWSLVLAINADAERFVASHPAGPTAASVLRFYVLDRSNPTSLVSDLHQARENARALRPLISTEMWVQLNVFYNRVAALRPADVSEERLARLCALVKEGCDTQAGITAGTFYRDEAWSFHQLGVAVECADQTTRLLDAKFLALKGRADAPAPGSAADASYWTALLRSAAGYQAFRRLHPRGMDAEQVAAFMICDPSFPRSVACNLGVIADELTRLRRRYRLRPAADALELLDELTATLDLRNVREALARGELHLFNDRIQNRLATLTEHLARSFFGHGPPPPPARRPQAPGGMTQTMGEGGMTQTMGGMTQTLPGGTPSGRTG